MNKPHARLSTVLAALAVSAGCGGSGPDVVEVSGRITKGGQPVSHAVIQFYPEQGRPSAGRSDGDGRYAPEFSQEISHGVMPGKSKVTIQVVQERIDEPINLNAPKYHPEMAEIVKRFGDWKRTPLEFDVTHEAPVIDIELDDYASPSPQ
ncbi:MAG: hypothetical protein AAF961_03645 [Planctomycetota bacterium]